MTIQKEMNGNEMTILLTGRLDTQTAPELGVEVDAIGGDVESLTLDFANLEYISSAGLRQIVAAHRKMAGRLAIQNVSDEVLDIFKMTGFDTRLNIY